MAQDKWGIRFIYPTKSTAGVTGTGTGFTWFQKNNPFDDDVIFFGKEEDDVERVGSADEFIFPYLSGATDLSLSGPTGHHSGGENHGCEGFTYMVSIDWTSNPAKFKFRKETYHVEYDDHPDGEWTHPKVNFRIKGHGWVGSKWVIYNKKDGRSKGKDSRIMEIWFNPDVDADINNWIMLKRVEDKGGQGWGVRDAGCDDSMEYQVGTWSNIQFRLKASSSDFSLHPREPERDGNYIHSIGGANMSFTDSEARGYGYKANMPRDVEMTAIWKIDSGTDVHYKHLSLREIDAEQDFDDEPDNPGTAPPVDQPNTPVTVKGSLKLQRDINIQRTSPCSPAGLKSFFSTLVANPDGYFQIADHSTFDNHTRAGELCRNSDSVMKGHTIQQLDVKLRKVGTPGSSPVVNAHIVDGGHIIRYTSPTNLNPTTLTTSFDTKSFDFSTNTRAFQTGDSVVIEYLGDSDDDYIEIGIMDNEIPSPNSQFTYYDKGENEWVKLGGNDICGVMYEDV